MVPKGLQGASEVDPPSKPSADARVLPAVGSVGAQCCRVCSPWQVCLWRPPCLFKRRAACSWRPAVCPPSTRVGSPAPPVPVMGPRGGLHAAAPPLAGRVASPPVLLSPPLPPIWGLRPLPPAAQREPEPTLPFVGQGAQGHFGGRMQGAQACRGGDWPGLASGSVEARGWLSQAPDHTTDAENSWREHHAVGRARQ